MATAEATQDLTLVRVMGRNYRQFLAVNNSNNNTQADKQVGRRGRGAASNGSANNGSHSSHTSTAATTSNIMDGSAATEDEEGLEVQRTRDGQRQFLLRKPIAEVFHRFIVGRKGETIKRLMAETGARIVVPRQPPAARDKQASSKSVTPIVSITAKSASAVRSAETRLEIVIADARDKLDFTHFISVPLALDADARNKLQEMQQRIFASQSCRDVSSSWIDHA